MPFVLVWFASALYQCCSSFDVKSTAILAWDPRCSSLDTSVIALVPDLHTPNHKESSKFRAFPAQINGNNKLNSYETDILKIKLLFIWISLVHGIAFRILNISNSKRKVQHLVWANSFIQWLCEWSLRM